MWGGGSSSTYLFDRVESKSFRLINAPHLTVALFEVAPRCCFSLSLFYRYYFGRCSEELNYCVSGPKTGGAILGLLLPHMNSVWRWATRASIDMVPASFRSQVICGTLWLLLPFPPLKISLLSKVGDMDTSEASIIDKNFYSFLIF